MKYFYFIWIYCFNKKFTTVLGDKLYRKKIKLRKLLSIISTDSGFLTVLKQPQFIN